MAKYSMSRLITLFVLLLVGASSARLSSNFYQRTCPKALDIIERVVRHAVWKEPRMGASILRLHFHDCFSQGCDASVLLDDTPTFTGEKTALPNNNSIRGFEVIDDIKSQIEKMCPGIVSCADILTVAARDSVYALGGPSWSVPLGRRDSRTASFSEANANLPSPFSNLSGLVSSFNKQGLSARDMVTLSGGHTIGFAQCRTFRGRIYNDSNINAEFATFRKRSCPISGGDTNLAPIDVTSPKHFDNAYYRNLKVQEGLFHSDQELFNGGFTDNQVRNYAANPVLFMNDFARAMVKMANISLLTGSSGEIRKNCRKINS